MKDFGDKLRALRAEKGITQKELANILAITVPTLSHWECGYQEPSFRDLISLCNYFNVESDYLIGRSDDFGNVTVQSSAPALSAEEKELLALFRQMPHNAKVKAKAYCEGLVDAPPSSNRLA